MRCTLRLSLAALIVLSAALSTPASADTDEPARNAVTTNPARFAFLHFQVEYERAAGDAWSVFLAPIVFHHAHWYPFAPSDVATATGFGADAGARWFWRGDAMRGWYAGPYLSAYRASVDVDGTMTLDGYVVSPGAQLGYSYLIGRWMLAAGAGLSYGFATDEGPDGTPKAEQLPHRGAWLNLRVNAGITF